MAYNGWANRDTWLVTLWMDNEERNYRYVLKNIKKLMTLSKVELFATLRANLHFGDKVNWNNVRVGEIRSHLREYYLNH